LTVKKDRYRFAHLKAYKPKDKENFFGKFILVTTKTGLEYVVLTPEWSVRKSRLPVSMFPLQLCTVRFCIDQYILCKVGPGYFSVNRTDRPSKYYNEKYGFTYLLYLTHTYVQCLFTCLAR